VATNQTDGVSFGELDGDVWQPKEEGQLALPVDKTNANASQVTSANSIVVLANSESLCKRHSVIPRRLFFGAVAMILGRITRKGIANQAVHMRLKPFPGAIRRRQ
jgi:hypothetical protein